MVQCDLLCGDVAGGGFAAGGNIDQAGAQVVPGDDLANEAQLLALGVERTDNQHDRRSRRRLHARFASLPRGAFDANDGCRDRTCRGLDTRNGRRLRPARRQSGIGDIDPDRRPVPRAHRLGTSLGVRVGGGGDVRFDFSMDPDTQQALLQVAVGRQTRGIR